MPKYLVTGPDGATYNVEAPEGATEAQVMARVRASAPKAAPKRRGTGIGAVDNALSWANETLIGMGQGAFELGAAATYDNPLGRAVFGDKLVDKANSQRRQVYDAARDATVANPMPGARMGGQVISTLPLAKLRVLQTVANAPKLLNAAKLAAQGAIGGVSVRDPEQGTGGMAALGAASNMVLSPVISRAVAMAGPPLAKAGRWLGGTTPGRAITGAADDLYDTLAPRMLPARYQPPAPLPSSPVAAPTPLGTATGSAGAQAAAPDPVAALSRKAQARKATFDAAGVKSPTTGMVTRDPTVWQFEQNNAGIVGPEGNTLRGAMVKVNEDLNRAAERLVSAKGRSGDPEVVGRAVVDALDAKQAEMQAVTGRLYAQVREARGDVPAGDLGNFREAIESADMLDNPVFDQMRDGVLRRLNRFGMYNNGLPRRGAVATVGQAEELRKFVGGLGDGKDPSVKMMRARLIEALDDDVVATVGDDAFRGARESAKARFQEFKNTFAGDVAGGRVAPERLPARILAKNTTLAQVRALKRSLTTGTDEQVSRGAKALEDLGAQALEDMFDDARIGDDMMSGARLSKAFGKAAPKLRELLSPAEFKQLQRIVTATRYATVPVDYSFVNNSRTTAALANLFGEAKPTNTSSIKTILKHIGAFTAAGPAGNVGVAVADGIATKRAQSQAQAALQAQVARALSPQAAGMAVQDELAARQALAAALRRQQFASQRLPYGLAPALGPEAGRTR